jgi:hypothetical protein
MANDHEIIYFVNGEPQTTATHKRTVIEILELAGFTPATDYDLNRDNGHHQFSDYAEEVPLHDGERFTATFKGPTPTS